MNMITRLGQHRVLLEAGVATKEHSLWKISGLQIVKVASLAIYNSHATQTVTFYAGIRRHGLFHRYHHKATLAAKCVELVDVSLYLHNGDELLVTALGSGAATTFECSFQTLDVGGEQ